MSNPYDAPAPEVEDIAMELAMVPNFRWAPLCLNISGVIYLGVAAMGPCMGGLISSDPTISEEEAFIMSAMMTVLLLPTGLFFAALNFVTANQLQAGKKWAYFVALCLGLLYIPSGFFLFGVGILLPLLNAECRKLFGL